MKKYIANILLFFVSTGLQANISQSPEVLSHKIETYLLNQLAAYQEGNIKVIADKIDSRLSLKACADEKLTVFNPYQTPLLNATVMGIKCQENDNQWTLYVPIKISVLKTVYVAKQAMMKGTKIRSSDIYASEMDIQKLTQGYFSDSKELIGQMCKKDIGANRPFNPHNIELAKLIHKGEQVAIIAQDGNLRISMDGVAMSEGIFGDTIKVKNLSSNKIIEAQIAGKKEVTVIL